MDLHALVRRLDNAIGKAQVAISGDQPALLCFAFHAIAPAPQLASLDRALDPTLAVSTEALDRFIEYFASLGYGFVTPQHIADGLEPGQRFVMLTFDDGYRNNLYALPVLKAHRVPATFFISTRHVETQDAFWWDVLYRERSQRQTPHMDIVHEQSRLKASTHDDIHAYLRREFGPDALRPVGDDDRPMTIEELADFARHPEVQLGNHTANHAVLTSYASEEAAAQIVRAQEDLQAWTGRTPLAIAYPNGNHSPSIRAAARQAGLQFGFTLEPHRNPLRVRPDSALQLGRFLMPRRVVHDLDLISHRAPFGLRRTVTNLRNAIGL